MEIIYPKYLTTRLPNDINDKFVVTIGIKDSGKTGCLLSLAEYLMQFWGKKNTEVLIFDPDSRINQDYTLENLFDFSEARKEVKERYESCTKPHFIFMAPDARKLLSEYFSKKEERKEVLDFGYWFAQSRHLNPDVKDAVWGVGLTKFEHLSSTLRAMIDSMIYKSSIGSISTMAKFWGVRSRKQIYKLFEEVAFRVSVQKYVELGSVFLPRLYKWMLFRTPHILIDFNKKRTRRETEVEQNAETIDERIEVSEKGYQLIESSKTRKGRLTLIKQDLGFYGGSATQSFEDVLKRLAEEIYPHIKPKTIIEEANSETFTESEDVVNSNETESGHST